MKDLRSRIARELLWAPSVVLPIVAGASAWLLSFATGGVSLLNLAGIVCVLGGIGWLATRVIFFSDDIAAKITREDAEKIIRDEENKLDDLLVRLRVDKDYRTKDYLTLLRTCRSEFEQFATKSGIELQSLEIVKQVRQLFWSAIDQLEQSLKLHALADKLMGEQKKNVIAQREEILAEIQTSVEHMQSAVNHYRELMNTEQHNDLGTLRDELDASIRIAKRTEERMRELEGSTNLESYLKE